MPKLFFTSDLHFGHKNVIKYCNRPYQHTFEMETALVANWNSVVSPEDTVIVVGDVFFCGSQLAVMIMKRLNGYKILVKGNHDKSLEKMKSFGFDEVYEKHEVEIEGRNFKVCHFPFKPFLGDVPEEVLRDLDKVRARQMQMGLDRKTEIEDALNRWQASGIISLSQLDRLKAYDMRFISKRFENDGAFLICGHVHNSWLKKDRMVNVGVDVWGYKPILASEVVRAFNDPREFLKLSTDLDDATITYTIPNTSSEEEGD